MKKGSTEWYVEMTKQINENICEAKKPHVKREVLNVAKAVINFTYQLAVLTEKLKLINQILDNTFGFYQETPEADEEILLIENL